MEKAKYFGYLVRQRTNPNTTPFFVFCSKAKEVRKWVGIRRTIEIAEGHQRRLRPARANAVKNYLSSDPINTIPSNILVAFDKNRVKFTSLDQVLSQCIDVQEMKNGCSEAMQWGFIEFEYDPASDDKDRPALIVDGQHRLYGIDSFGTEDLPILVVSLIDADRQEQAFQFIVVNNKQVKVPTDNIKSIIADLNLEQLEARVTKAGVKFGDHSPLLRQVNDLSTSPFYKLLTWDYNRDRNEDDLLVPVTAIEQSFKFIQSTFDFMNEDTDTLLDFFLTTWDAVKKTFPDLWNKEPKFMKKVNITALNELLVHNLRALWKQRIIDILNSEDIQKYTAKLIKDVPVEFWATEWTIRIQDNSNVRGLIQKDIDRINENIMLEKPWREGLELVAQNMENTNM